MADRQRISINGPPPLALRRPRHHRVWYHNGKLLVIFVMGVVTTLYSLLEIVIALKYSALVMLTDGLHNFSDAGALAVGFWAENKKLQMGAEGLTYGWRRTELLGGLFNGFFLLSMSIFITLEAIPKFISPDEANRDGDMQFIIISGVGIVINVIGTILFGIFGGGHGHSHGGGGGGGGGGEHGHAHGGVSSSASKSGSRGHGHGHGTPAVKGRSHGHDGHDDHDHEGHDGHGHGHGHGALLPVCAAAAPATHHSHGLDYDCHSETDDDSTPLVVSDKQPSVKRPTSVRAGHLRASSGSQTSGSSSVHRKHNSALGSVPGAISHRAVSTHDVELAQPGASLAATLADVRRQVSCNTHSDEEHGHAGHGHAHGSASDDEDHGHSHSGGGHGHGGGEHAHAHGGAHGHDDHDDHHDDHSEHGHAHSGSSGGGGRQRHGHGRDEGEHHGHAHGEQGRDHDAHGDHAHGEQGRDHDAHGDHAHGEQGRDHDAHGDHAHGEQGRDHDAHGDHAHGEQGRDHDAHDDHAHGEQGRDHDDDNEEGGHDQHSSRDHNMWGLFIHFLGDVLTSILVLSVGIIYYFFDHQSGPTRDNWVNYMDPAASMLSIAIIMVSVWPLIKACSWILLQSSPAHVNLTRLRRDILALPMVQGLHELHVWQLVDGVSIGSVHVVTGSATDLHDLVGSVKNVLHRYGIHSSSIQPELQARATPISHASSSACVVSGTCVQDCEAETCCPQESLLSDA